MSKLEIAKEIIAAYIKHANCGIYNTRNTAGDLMNNLYDLDGLVIDICYEWSYFEVFGLTNDEFAKLREYYKSLL